MQRSNRLTAIPLELKVSWTKIVINIHTCTTALLCVKDILITTFYILKVLVTLSFLSSGSYQRRIGQDFLSSMCQSSVSGAIHSIINAINMIMPQWIKFPILPAEIQTIQEQYDKINVLSLSLFLSFLE